MALLLSLSSSLSSKSSSSSSSLLLFPEGTLLVHVTLVSDIEFMLSSEDSGNSDWDCKVLTTVPVKVKPCLSILY